METYADWLRARGDDELRALLSARPELIAPVPADLTALAARAATPTAISRALDRLDRFTLATLEALLVLPAPVKPRTLSSALGATASQSGAAVEKLRQYGLVWGKASPTTAPGVRQGLPHPAGLGPPVQEVFAYYNSERLTQLIIDLDGAEPRGFPDSPRLLRRLAELLAAPEALIRDAGPEARAALEQLAWGPPVGRVADARRPVRIDTATTPIERLLARGLLAAEDDRTVSLPREVALHLRGGRLFRDVSAQPPRSPPPHPRAQEQQAGSRGGAPRRTAKTWSSAPRRARRSTPCGWSRSCWSGGASTRRPSCAAVASRSATCARRLSSWTSRSGRRPCSSRSPTRRAC